MSFITAPNSRGRRVWDRDDLIVQHGFYRPIPIPPLAAAQPVELPTPTPTPDMAPSPRAMKRRRHMAKGSHR